MNKIKVLLIEKESKDSELISETLSNIDYMDLVGHVESQEEADYYIDENYPNVIIIGMNLDLDRHSLAQYLHEEFSDIAIIMIEEELKEDTMYRALFVGAKDVIISPFSSAKLVDSVYRAEQLVKGKEMVHKETSTRLRKRGKRGHVITVFSTKGGVGKTFVTTNLAVALAKDTDKKVCLVDLDLDFGNAVLALNMVPRLTILDTVDDIRNIDESIIESYLIPHESGIKVLPANAKPQINEFINAEHVEIILRAVQGAFDYVVVDMPARFYEPVNPAFHAADILLMVTTPEISAVRNIKSTIQTLQELNYPKSKIKVVLNKADSSGQIKSKDVESTLNQALYSVIPADYKRAILSLNDGIPITMGKPRNPMSKSFMNLSSKIKAEFNDNASK